MHKIMHLPVNYFNPRVGRDRNLQESLALLSLPLHGSGFFPGFSAVWKQWVMLKETGEVKTCSTLLRLWQRKNLGWPPAALSCTCTEESQPLSYTHIKLHGREMGNALLSLQIPLPTYFSMASKTLLLILRKKFAFLQEELPSQENIWLHLHPGHNKIIKK